MKDKPNKILIVDDEPANLAVLRLSLEASGYDVYPADSGAGALRSAPDYAPDLILLDVKMPDMDGYQVCQQLKSHPQLASVPVIFVSAGYESFDKLRGFEVGGVDYVTKPLDLDVLLARVELHLKISQQQREIEHLHAQDRQRIDHLNREIQSRTAAEQALRQERDLAQLYLDIAGVIMVVLNPAGDILLLNKQGYRILGYAEGELLGQNWFERCLPDAYRPRVKQVFDQLTTGENASAEQYENPVLTKSGAERLVRWRNACQYDTQGNMVAVLASGEDITERKQAEAALQESEQRFRTLFEHSPDAIVLLDPHDPAISWPIVDCNDRFCHMNGYERDELLGQSIDMVHEHPEDPAQRAAYLNQLRQEKTLIGHTDHCRKDGTLFPIRFSTTLVNLNGQELVMGIDHDLTEQRRMETLEREQRVLAEALTETAATLNSTLHLDDVLQQILINVGRVVPHDAANIMLIENGSAHVVRCQGYAAWTTEELVVATHYRINETSNLQQMWLTQQPLVLPEVDTLAGWIKEPPADWIQSYVGAPIAMADQVVGFINLDSATPNFFAPHHADRLRAFTNQAAIAIENAQLYQELENYSASLEHAVEERTAELRASEERYRTITRNLPHGLVHIFDRDLRYVFSDGEELKRLGLTHAMLVGRHLHDVLDTAAVTVFEEHLRRVWQGETVKFENEFSDQSFLTSAAPLLNPANEITQVLVFSTNITDRKRAETALRQTLAREMELGEMRSRFLSIATHDMRTPLAVIQSSAEMLIEYEDRLSEAKKREKIERIRNNIKPMVDLLNDILTIERIEANNLQFQPTRVDLAAFCQSLLRDFQESIGTAHRFEVSITGPCPVAMLDRKLLQHIMGNLLSNAIKYSPAGSTITVDLQCGTDQAVFRLQDEGIGIPAADQAHLFDTFYRATNVGGITGTGLGLSIVKLAVSLHGGTITFESQEGQGTCFSVTIPYGSPGENSP